MACRTNWAVKYFYQSVLSAWSKVKRENTLHSYPVEPPTIYNQTTSTVHWKALIKTSSYQTWKLKLMHMIKKYSKIHHLHKQHYATVQKKKKTKEKNAQWKEPVSLKMFYTTLKIVSTMKYINVYCIKESSKLPFTNLFPMQPFSNLWKYKKALKLSDVFKSSRKVALWTNGLRNVMQIKKNLLIWKTIKRYKIIDWILEDSK